MGLLDMFNDPRQAGLLAAAAQMMQMSGPSRTPTSLGQIIGGGIGAFGQASQDAMGRQRQEQESQQMQQIRALQIKQAQEEMIQHQRALSRAQGLQTYLSKKPDSRTHALSQMTGPTVQNAAALSQVREPMTPYEQRMSRAEYLRQGGYDQEAGAEELAALKFRPEFDQTPRVGRDQNGNAVQFVLDKQGNPKILPFAPGGELKLADTGDGLLAYDGFQLQAGKKFKKGYSPSDLINMRGQNLVSDRAREANMIAAQGNIVKTETDLRKEFADLPEVKRYKSAYPSFNAIQKAAKINNPQADINLVYGLAKLYDPESVVREGEYATIANSQAIPEWIKGTAQRLMGGGRLTEETKRQILEQANIRIKGLENEYSNAAGAYQGIATGRGAKLNNVITPVGNSGDGDIDELLRIYGGK